jgi:hypothetical protein
MSVLGDGLKVSRKLTDVGSKLWVEGLQKAYLLSFQ